MWNRSELELHTRKLQLFISAIENYRKDISQHIWHINLQTNDVENDDELESLQEKYLALALHEIKLKVIRKFLSRHEVNPLYLFGDELQGVFAGIDNLQEMTAEAYIGKLTSNIISQIEKESALPNYQDKTYVLISILLALLVISAVVASLFALFPNTEVGKILLVSGLSTLFVLSVFTVSIITGDSLKDYKQFLETDGAAMKSYSQIESYRFSASLDPEPAVKIRRVVPILERVDTTEFIPKRMLPTHDGELTREIVESRDYVRSVRAPSKTNKVFTSARSLHFGRSRDVLKNRFFATGADGVTVKAVVYGGSRAQQPVERVAISEHLTAVLRV